MITDDDITDFIDCRIWQKIENFMLEQGDAYEDLANKIGVSLRQMQRYEQGVDKTTLKMLYAIAEALSIDVTDLLPESTEYKGKGSGLVMKILSWIRKYRRTQDPGLRKVLYLLLKSILGGKENSSVIERIQTAKDLSDAGASFDVICQKIGLSTDGHDNIEEEIDSIEYQIKQIIKGYEDNEGENEQLSWARECKKIDDQESRDELDERVEFLSQRRQTYQEKEKINKAEAVKIANNLLRLGVSIDVISQVTGVPAEEIF